MKFHEISFHLKFHPFCTSTIDASSATFPTTRQSLAGPDSNPSMDEGVDVGVGVGVGAVVGVGVGVDVDVGVEPSSFVGGGAVGPALTRSWTRVGEQV